MKFSDSTKEVISALVKAQAGFESAKKTVNNPFFKSKYADLSEIIDVVKKPLSENNLAFVQTVEQTEYHPQGAGYSLKTVLFHASGESISSEYPIFSKGGDAQGFGAGVTYARRYALQTLLGISTDDDDGETASGRGGNTAKPVPARVPQPTAKTEPPTVTGIDFFKSAPKIKVEENEEGDIFISGQGTFPYRTSLDKLGFKFSPETKSWVKKAQTAA